MRKSSFELTLGNFYQTEYGMQNMAWDFRFLIKIEEDKHVKQLYWESVTLISKA